MSDEIDEIDDDDADEGAEGAEGTEGAKAAEAEAEAARAKSAAEALQAENTRLLKLVSDPDVAAVIQAKDANANLRIVVGEAGEDKDDDPLPEPADLDAMRGSQLLDVFTKASAKSVEAAMSTALGPLVEKVQELEGELGEARKARAKAQVAEFTKSFPDLPKHKKVVVDLTNKGLSLREAYAVARLRSGDDLLRPRSGSERPTTIRVPSSAKKTKARMGMRGFSQDLAEIIPEVDAEMKMA